MSTHDKLFELRQDAVDAWRIAIGLTVDAHAYVKDVLIDQSSVALKGAVKAQIQYTLACQICAQCGHRMIEHSAEDPPLANVQINEEYLPASKNKQERKMRQVVIDSLRKVAAEPCGCCVQVGRAMKEDKA